MEIQSAFLTNKNDSFFHLFSTLSDSIIIVNHSGTIIYVNAKAESMFRSTFSELKGHSIMKMIPGISLNTQDRREKKVYIGIRDYSRNFSLRIQTHSISIDNEEYKVILLKNLCEDKNEEMKTLNKELTDIKLALDASTIVAITDEKGIITLVNDKFCELSKYREEELLGQDHRILNSGYHPKEFFSDMWKTIGSGEIWKGEIQNKTKDGMLYWVDTTIVPFLDDNGKPYQYVSIRTDITKRVRMEKELQKAMEMNFINTMKNLQNGIFKVKKDKSGNFIYTMAEGKLLNEINSNSEKLLGKTPFDIYPIETARMMQAHFETAYAGERVNYEFELHGKLLYVDLSSIIQAEEVMEIVGSVHDITELRTTQRTLEVNQLQYQSLFEYSQNHVITFDYDGQIIDMNPTALELFGYSRTNIAGLGMKDLTPKKYEKMINMYFKKALLGNPQNFEVEVNSRSGISRFFNVNFLPIIVDKQVKGVYSIGKDVTEQKKIQDTNEYLAHHDELTKLPNRRWMEQKLCESLVEAKKKNHKLAVLFMDLDRFKSINDTLGHFVGDRLLESISSRIFNHLNHEHQFAARMGGDEFMILCLDVKNHEEVTTLAKKILEEIMTPFHIDEYELFVTGSVGISMYPEAGTNSIDLMKKADIALYKAKEQGRNTYQLYDHTMDERNFQSFILERDLRKALMKDEFIVHLQPRVNAQTGEIIAAEALIRWMHPQIGLVPPGEFIPLAEETGLIIPLGSWMKRKVCEQLCTWREAGMPLLPISVNISSKRFLQRDFSEEVSDLLTEYQLEGKWLEIEITENSLMKNEEYILETLQELKTMGIKIYIDDFGTGYSSFNYLKSFQLDGVKIDQSFIRNISNQSENAGITTAMIKMAQHLKMAVIAEGVETEAELSFLQQHDCHHIQGFYFGKPCSIEEFEEKYM